MKKIIFAAVFCVIMTGVSQAKGLLEQANLSVSGGFDYYSKYMWRGYTIYNDNVIQPSVSLGGYGFKANVWSSMPASTTGDSAANNDEVDITFSYEKFFDLIGLTLGHSSFQYPIDNENQTEEYFIGVTLNKLPFDFGITYNNDYDDDDGLDGTFVSFDISKELNLTNDITYTACAHYGIFNNYDNIDNGGDYSLGLKFNLPLADHLELIPSLNYMAPTGDVADENKGDQDDEFFTGLSLAYSF